MTVIRIRILGHVQGVGFRAWLKQEADRAAVRGWVSNRRDGSVEAVLSGDAPAVDRILASCRSGPPGADVSDVMVLSEEAAPPAAGFMIRQTF